MSLEVALQEALRSAKECAAACLTIVPTLPQSVRGPVGIVFGAASLATCHLEDESPDRPATLALCVRIIDSNLGWLDEAGDSSEALRAAAAARRCADRCRRALAALYLSR